MKHLSISLLVFTLAFAGCDSYDTGSPDAVSVEADGASVVGKRGLNPQVDRIVALVDGVNARLAAKGSQVRLDYPWLFVVGPGTDPFQQLRTGLRWQYTDPTYLLDESDYTTDVPMGDVDDALVSAYDSWNNVRRTTIEASRVPDDGGNHDILDAVVTDSNGDCIDIVDVTSPNLLAYDPSAGLFDIDPEADIVVGGWLAADYFANCLGDPYTIGVTWSFYGADGNGDNYVDLVYVEQFYNEAFDWTTTDAVYLDFSAPIDIETTAVHENGHAFGLGHFGGPLENQPFKLKPSGRVFNPTAVMNPVYLGGEDRSLYPTDEAGLSTLYARKKG